MFCGTRCQASLILFSFQDTHYGDHSGCILLIFKHTTLIYQNLSIATSFFRKTSLFRCLTISCVYQSCVFSILRKSGLIGKNNHWVLRPLYLTCNMIYNYLPSLNKWWISCMGIPGFHHLIHGWGVLFFSPQISREPEWQQSPEWRSCMWMIVQFSSDVVHVNPKFDDFFH